MAEDLQKNEKTDIRDMNFDEIVEHLRGRGHVQFLVTGCVHRYQNLLNRKISEEEWYEFQDYWEDNFPMLAPDLMMNLWNRWEGWKLCMQLDFDKDDPYENMGKSLLN